MGKGKKLHHSFSNTLKTKASEVCIINSRRSDIASDGYKCQRLLEAFGSTEDNTICKEVLPNNMRLERYQPWFHYPPDIREHVARLSYRRPCSDAANPRCCGRSGEPCFRASSMDRNPILWDNYFCTQIYLIQR